MQKLTQASSSTCEVCRLCRPTAPTHHACTHTAPPSGVLRHRDDPFAVPPRSLRPCPHRCCQCWRSRVVGRFRQRHPVGPRRPRTAHLRHRLRGLAQLRLLLGEALLGLTRLGLGLTRSLECLRQSLPCGGCQRVGRVSRVMAVWAGAVERRARWGRGGWGARG